MKVRELKELIKDLPDNMEICKNYDETFGGYVYHFMGIDKENIYVTTVDSEAYKAGKKYIQKIKVLMISV